MTTDPLFPFLTREEPPPFYIVRVIVDSERRPIEYIPRVTSYAVQWCASEIAYFVQHVQQHHEEDCYLRNAIGPRLVESLDPLFLSSLLTWVRIYERDRPAFCARAQALRQELTRILRYRHADVHVAVRTLLRDDV